jgi:hypothetical protein
MSESGPPIQKLGPALIAAGGIALAFGAIGLGVMIARHRPAPPLLTAPAALPAPVEPDREPEPEPLRLVVHRAASLPSSADPYAPVWFDAPAVDVPIQPQDAAVPMLEHGTVASARVRAVTDGRRIAFHVSWEAATPATAADTGLFSDAVGLQFPLEQGTSYQMGVSGMPVHIVYWRAQWQHDIDHGFQDVYAMYPNFFTCGYWFAEGDFPSRVPGSFRDSRSHEWFVARQAGNPMADFDRRRPVDEMIAEGFGTLTPLPNGMAEGRGMWRDGRWHVVLERPIIADNLSSQFQAGASSQFAVAVWDGSAGNVGARKHYSFWVPFEVQR